MRNFSLIPAAARSCFLAATVTATFVEILATILVTTLVAIPASAGPADGRTLPGDTIDNAFIIPSLPYEDHYHTIGYTADYCVVCPYAYGPQPDVVYKFEATEQVSVDISLCNPGTDYDTKVFVYENSVYNDIACNDDACTSPDFPYPYVSRLPSVPFSPGNIYYIVVTCYSGSIGNYTLTIRPWDPIHGVRPDGTGEYPTIQAAIDACNHADLVELADGVYTGPGNVNLDFAGREITLRSQSGNPQNCIIDGQGMNRGFRMTGNSGPYALVQGITVRGGSAADSAGGAVFVFNGSPQFRSCTFESNVALDGGAAACSLGTPKFQDCLFRQNWATRFGGGLYLSAPGPSQAAVNCTFTGNKATVAGGGIYAREAGADIIGCTIVDNLVSRADGHGGGVAASANSQLNVYTSIIAFNHAPSFGGLNAEGAPAICCDLYGNDHGDWNGPPEPPGWLYTISLDPLFCNFEEGDYGLQADSPCIPNPPGRPMCPLTGAHPVTCPASGVAPGNVSGGPRLTVSPNPSRSGCEFSINGLPAGPASIAIIDPSGRAVRRLSASVSSSGGSHLWWDGRNSGGQTVPAGLYFARLIVSGAELNLPARVLVLR